MNKLVKNGKVAILYSPEYGTGWSSQNHAIAEWMCLGEEVCQAFLDHGNEAAAKLVESKYPDACTLGFKDLKLTWLDQGTRFIIEEYDGYESIKHLDDINFFVA